MTTTENTPDLYASELYINRELSLLEFNRRVLELSKAEHMPLLERLRYLCISSTNLDEFFEIRVAGLKEKSTINSIHSGPDDMTPTETLKSIRAIAEDLVAEQYRVLDEELFPLLEKEKIRFIRRSDWTPEQEAWLKQYFKESLLPMLSPMGLDPAHPFPRIISKALSFIISLQGKDAFGRDSGMAVVQAPRSLPRLIQLPCEEGCTEPHTYVFLSSIIHAYVEELFNGMQVTGTYQFRITRNSDLFVDTEEVDDLLHALEGELLSRRYSDVVRLEVASECPQEITQFLLKTFELEEDDLYRVNGPVNLNRLLQICDIDDRSDLHFKSFNPGLPSRLRGNPDMFAAISKQDILLYHPFESFLPFVDFLRQASIDPEVLAIKQTLYRTGPKSAVVDALVQAARNNKEVTVIIEIRARFDEADNITLANRLQEAGAHVVYGVVGYKTHVKMALVIRREKAGLKRYVQLSTGNYHPRNARIYTDYGLFTCDKGIGADVHNAFTQLTGLGKVSKLNKILQAPFTMHEVILEKINRETENAEKGLPAKIVVKMNALIEANVVRALYRASMAGVKVDLIIRGICRIRPGVPGISENITVRSIVGRFLEHTRVMYFQNNDKPEIYCSSADWMERNFFQRVELAFPITSKRLSTRIIRHLEYYLKDNVQSWALNAEGQYERLHPAEGEEAFSAQDALLEDMAEK
ncbi:MAG: polyphosphate kinase 1 [Gammaproteobacteria bacterium]|nr:polyphosphate kinase 1 [Gammaproteobacteria bacterium]